MNIIVIEDEQLTANDLARTIARVEPDARIVAILGSVKEAIDFFSTNRTKIDLIFSDIQLGDGLSFEIFNRQTTHTPIIFCTAYDEYALNAFSVSGIHYMLKPFSTKSVSDAIGKFRELKQNLAESPPPYETILELLNNRKSQKSVLVYQNDRILPIRTEDIALFYIDNEIVYIITFDQKRFTVQKTLEELEGIVGGNFYRANRQFLVSRRAIKDSAQYFGRKLVVNLTIKFNDRITVSKAKVAEFLEWLSG